MNEIAFYLERTDKRIIELWNMAYMPERIAEKLDIPLEYIEDVIEDEANYSEDKGGETP